MLMIHRSGMTGKEVSKKLKIHPSHLSKVYRSEFLTENLRRKASELFGESMDVWSDYTKIGMVMEPQARYGIEEEESEVAGMSAEEVLAYLQKKDDQYHAERMMLMKIIDNLTLMKK
ncbi:MAG: hypothetical protein E6Q97_31455 [Desulfurellales bacterium]|nr:MAG: hypothetical protein E6Q97_31455 [Desulfurellales bacterium]